MGNIMSPGDRYSCGKKVSFSDPLYTLLEVLTDACVKDILHLDSLYVYYAL